MERKNYAASFSLNAETTVLFILTKLLTIAISKEKETTMKKILFYLLVILPIGLGCVRQQPVQRIPFPSSEYAQLFSTGTATITGQAFLKTRGGTVKYAAGNEVFLNPVTTYSTQWYNNAYLHSRPMTPVDSRINQYIFSTIADGEGKFTFLNISEGDYYLSTSVFWEVPTQYSTGLQGGILCKKITVKKDEHNKIILTDTTIDRKPHSSKLKSQQQNNFKSKQTQKGLEKYKTKKLHKAFFIDPHDNNNFIYVWGYKNKREALQQQPINMLLHSLDNSYRWEEELAIYKQSKLYVALSAFNNRDYASAQYLLSRLSTQHTKNPHINNRLAWAGVHLVETTPSIASHIKEKTLESSLEAFNSSIKNGWDKKAGNYEGKALTLWLQGNYAQAFDVIKEGKQKCGSHPHLTTLLARFYIEKKKFGAAKSIVGKKTFWGISFNKQHHGLVLNSKPFPNSPASLAGLQTNDVITKINEVSLANHSVQESLKVLHSIPYKQQVTITYLREGKKLTALITPFITSEK